MLAVQPYRPGRYPPGRNWIQFGDDSLGHAISAADEAWGKLAAKRQGMAQFHMDRLQKGGLVPLSANPMPRFAQPVQNAFTAHLDREDQFVEAYDRPQDLPKTGYETPSEATLSPISSPRELAIPEPSSSSLEPLGRVARAGFELVGHAGNYAGTSLKHNLEDGVAMAKSGLAVAGQVGTVLAKASKRKASASVRRAARGAAQAVSFAHQSAAAAMEPGSNTRLAIAETAHATGALASSAAGAAKTVLETAGPPIIHGGYAAAAVTAHGLKHGAIATAHGVGHVAHGVGHVAAAAADVASTHVIPALKEGYHYGMTLASEALSKASLKATDIIEALNELKGEEGFSAHNALENGRTEAIGNGRQQRKSRTDTPPRRRNVKPAAAAATPPEKPAYDHSYNNAQEWLEYSHNRGALVEELYKRPNWRNLVQHSNTPELRKKLLAMSPTELAEILVKLDHM